MSNEIAQTIFQQLGGQRFVAMTGARDFTSHKNVLTFRLPSSLTTERGTHMRIRLDSSDTYTVELLRFRKLELKTIKTASDVHAENLREVFTGMTGLATSL